MKNGAYVANLDECKSIGTHRIALYVTGNNVTYFNTFGIEQILKEVKTFIANKSIIGIQVYVSIMWGCFGIGFIYLMFQGKSLTDFSKLLLPHNFERMTN